jgi:hypothetical protein
MTTTRTETNHPNHAKQPGPWSWRRLLRAAALTSVANSTFGLITLGAGEAVVMAVLVGIGLLWLRRSGRGPVVYLGVVHLLIGVVVLVLFELLPELAYPASWKRFVWTGAWLVSTGTALVATVGALRRYQSTSPAARALAAIAGIALLAIVIVGIGARLNVSDDPRQPGDLALQITSETLWSPRELSVPAGKVAVYVENQGNHHGNFTIDGVANLDIPAGSAQRTTFDLAPGQYRYYSKLYPEEMNGTIFAS